jgi:hypothetical protein
MIFAACRQKLILTHPRFVGGVAVRTVWRHSYQRRTDALPCGEGPEPYVAGRARNVPGRHSVSSNARLP